MAKAKAASAGVLARMLVGTLAFGVEVKPDDVVSGSDEQIKHLVDAGVADDNEGAVKYAMSLEGGKFVELVDPAAAGLSLEQAKQALAEEIANLEADLAAAADDKKAEIEASLQAARYELAELEA